MWSGSEEENALTPENELLAASSMDSVEPATHWDSLLAPANMQPVEAEQNDHTFVFQALTADEEERGGGSKGEETERMDDSWFMTAPSRTNTAAHVRCSLQGRVINTPVENT